MLNRHQSRELVLQAIFNFDFLGYKGNSLEIYKNILKSFYKDKCDEDKFSLDIFNGVVGKKEELDKILIKYLKDWDLNKTSVIDRSILRIGLYELLYVEDVPAKVSINEYIELAKAFGHKNSYKFISGVLGKVFEKELSGKQ